MCYVHFGHVLSLLYAPMQECIEKYFLQYFTKAFSVLPNTCNTSNWSIMADLNLEAAVDHRKYKKYV